MIDDQDFAAVWAAERDGLLRVAFLIVADRALAEDVVADAVAKVLVRWRSVPMEALGAYLQRSVVNEAVGRWRRRASERRALERSDGRPRDPEDALETVLARDVLWRALRDLPAHQRAVVVLRFYSDWSVAQTASALSISEGTVKSRLARAMDRLRGELDVHGRDDAHA
jgi:RNA polymerase sigma-70 factor (sigma-E family)